MVSHVISLLAALPLNSNTKREKHENISLLLEELHEQGKECSDTDQNGGF